MSGIPRTYDPKGEFNETYPAPPGGWVCFHCGSTFYHQVLARRHFGSSPQDLPRCVALTARVKELEKLLNTPETDDFLKGVQLEAAHQRTRFSSEHDAGKTAFDWFWLIGYLAQKAAAAEVAGDLEKAKHHTISTAAALANWHLRLSGGDNSMRPGIEEPHG